MSFISSFEIIKAVVRGVEDEGRPEPCFFLISASIAEAAAVIPNGAKIFFAKGIVLSLMGLLFYSIMILKILQIELFQKLEL